MTPGGPPSATDAGEAVLCRWSPTDPPEYDCRDAMCPYPHPERAVLLPAEDRP